MQRGAGTDVMAVPASILREEVRRLGLSGRPLCVHSSLRSFGYVEGGAPAVVESLLAERCTVLVPAFTSDYRVPPPAGWRLPRNGWNYDAFPAHARGGGKAFTPATHEIDAEMGAIPAAVLARPERERGYHPSNSLAAVGPLARELVRGQQPLDVYAPLEALIDRGGAVVLMGVGLDRMTLLHVAERRAGRTLFRRWASGRDGESVEVETGGCSNGFPRLAPALEPLQRTAMVGQSVWRVFEAGQVVDAAACAIAQEPSITHCGDADCERCNDAVLGGPILAER